MEIVKTVMTDAGLVYLILNVLSVPLEPLRLIADYASVMKITILSIMIRNARKVRYKVVIS